MMKEISVLRSIVTVINDAVLLINTSYCPTDLYSLIS